jgi:hypothetical protein
MKKSLFGSMSAIMRLAIVAFAVFGVTYAISWFSGRNKAAKAAAAAAKGGAGAGAAADQPLVMTPLPAAPVGPAPVVQAASPAAAAAAPAGPAPVISNMGDQEALGEQEVLGEVIGEDGIDATDDDSSVATPAVVA